MNKFDHIVYDRFDFVLQTRAMKEFHASLLQCLYHGIYGAFFIGRSRIGKTAMVSHLQNRLVTRFNEPIPSVFLTIHDMPSKSSKSILELICEVLGFEVSARANANKLAAQITYRLEEMALKTRERIVVLFVDEAQRLTPEKLQAFVRLNDQLELAKISLFVFFVGNIQESQALFHIIKQDRYAHLRGRFFTKINEIRGIRNKQDLLYCLKQYDNLHYPVDSGPTYTENYLPEAYKEGFRLVQLGDAIWNTYKDLKKMYRLHDLEMQYFVSAIRILLTDYLLVCGTDSFSEEMMLKCYEYSGLLPELTGQSGDD